MYETIHVTIVKADEVLPLVTDHAGIGVQFYGPNLTGGPLTISFGNASDPHEGIEVAERVRQVLTEALNALYSRAGKTICPIHGTACRPVWHKGSGVPGAGDPDGVSHDAPLADR